MSFRFPSICFVLSFWLAAMNAADVNQTKALCYSGSTLYQQITQNCNEKDPSYTGTWYCSKIEVCESNISPYRQCIVTRGCATAAQCANAGGIYSNSVIQLNGQLPAGMTMKATCCAANDFPSDDTVAIDYEQICNSAPSSVKIQPFGVLVALATVVALFIYF